MGSPVPVHEARVGWEPAFGCALLPDSGEVPAGAGRGLVSLKLGRSPPPRLTPQAHTGSASSDALTVMARGRTTPDAVGLSRGKPGVSRLFAGARDTPLPRAWARAVAATMAAEAELSSREHGSRECAPSAPGTPSHCPRPGSRQSAHPVSVLMQSHLFVEREPPSCL